MSAFFVGFDHVNVLLSFANICHSESLPAGDAEYNWIRTNDAISMEKLGRILVAENIKSLMYRYPQDMADDHAEVDSYQLVWNRSWLINTPLSTVAVSIIKLCDCYDYQACETPEYKDSHAANIIKNIRQMATRRLAGYDAAPWQYLKGVKAVQS